LADLGAGQLSGRLVLVHPLAHSILSLLLLRCQQAAVDPQFGGGYAEQVGKFVQGVAAGQAGSAQEILTKFWDELQLLKEAVAKSTGNYQAMDQSSAGGITSAGGQS
jgi:hypothetical protein